MGKEFQLGRVLHFPTSTRKIRLDYHTIAMSHAKSLRVIGQALEVAKVFVFNLENDGRNYMVQSDSMSRTAEWMLRYAATES
jgi:hypothetical protein